MAISDPVADMLTKIRNASKAHFEQVDVYNSTLKQDLAKILLEEGYISAFEVVNESGVDYIRMFLKYDEKKNPVIHGITKISTPGRRIYAGYKKLPRIYNGLGTLIVSTSSGVITGKKASEKKIGGELICSIW